MKRILWSAISVVAFAAAAFWAVGQMEQSQMQQLPSLMPTGALLSIEARDFSSLLKDWNSSAEKRAWVDGDDYQEFSRSRLLIRLSQAQGEFSAAAGISTDDSLLNAVAGKQSCLAIYDIGNLEFLYVTRMSQHDAENTPLWQIRAKFEQRSEGAAQFYVRQDPQSGRVAAFAAANGWMILGTREDLVAGVLNRLQSATGRSLADEAWYADSVKQASGAPGDLRMVLNLGKLVPSPYFRSYWVQRNITEMKQYASAVSDLYRSSESYREERVLLRKPDTAAPPTGDVKALASLAPADADFYSAQLISDLETVLVALRDTLLEVKPAAVESSWSAPPPQPETQAGSATMLEERIDQAPVVVRQADPFEPLRALLRSAQPAQMLQVGSAIASDKSSFVRIQMGMVIVARQPWDALAVQRAVSSALQPGLTAGQMGLGWIERSGKSGEYFALDGRVPLYFAVRGERLYFANTKDLLEQMLGPEQATPAAEQDGVTFTAVFRHSNSEQQIFQALFSRLDRAGNTPGSQAEGQTPPFFSGNLDSLNQMFRDVERETVSERDQGAKVLETVSYDWSQ
jgi:hypothetical protein